jgi:hypothetical protein
MVHPVQVRPINDDEGNRLLRIVRRGTESVVTWRRAQMVLLSAQHMPVAKIAEVTFTSPDRVGTCCTTSTPTGSTRSTPATPAAGHRSSPCPSASRSRRSR